MKQLAPLALLFCVSQVWAAEVRILASNAVTDLIREQAPLYEKASGDKVRVDFSPTNALLERFNAGEHADVLILGRQVMIDLEKQGKVVPGTRVDVAQSGVALSVREGEPKPDISTPEAFKQALLSARSIATSRVGLSGEHFMKVLDRLDIADQVKPKLKIVDGSARTGELVARGEADMAVQLVSELLPVSGTQVVGVFPKGLDNAVVVTGGVTTQAMDAKAAKAFIDFLMLPAMLPALESKGLERP